MQDIKITPAKSRANFYFLLQNMQKEHKFYDIVMAKELSFNFCQEQVKSSIRSLQRALRRDPANERVAACLLDFFKELRILEQLPREGDFESLRVQVAALQTKIQNLENIMIRAKRMAQVPMGMGLNLGR
ncbi:MAG: hypothetical protein ACE5EK_00180 [Nitrospinales bacterium]